jgi:hypothetical protein
MCKKAGAPGQGKKGEKKDEKVAESRIRFLALLSAVKNRHKVRAYLCRKGTVAI